MMPSAAPSPQCRAPRVDRRGQCILAPVNLLGGFTQNQIISIVLSFIVFGGVSTCVIASLVTFYLFSRPRNGRVAHAAVWPIVALFWFMWAEVALVWAAPAESAFVNANGDNVLLELSYAHFQKILWCVAFAVIGLICMAIGLFLFRRERRREGVVSAQRQASAGGIVSA